MQKLQLQDAHECFDELLHAITPRVLQLYPLKENLAPRFPMPSVGKEVGSNFQLNKLPSGTRQEMGIVLQNIAL
jgi:hypothetical protein